MQKPVRGRKPADPSFKPKRPTYLFHGKLLRSVAINSIISSLVKQWGQDLMKVATVQRFFMSETTTELPRKPTRKSTKHTTSTTPSQEQNRAAEPDEQALVMEGLTKELGMAKDEIKRATQKIEDQASKINELSSELKVRDVMLLKKNEQAELIDDLTGRLQEMEIRLVASGIQNRHVVAQNISKTHMIAGMSLGLLPAPLFDIAVLTGTQLSLIHSLSKHYHVDFDEKTGKALVTSLLTGSLPVLTVLGLSSIAKVIPGIGTIGGGISMTVMAGAVVYATGQVFIQHFETGGTLQNFDSKHWQSFFRQQLEEGKAFVKSKGGKNKSELE